MYLACENVNKCSYGSYVLKGILFSIIEPGIIFIITAKLLKFKFPG